MSSHKSEPVLDSRGQPVLEFPCEFPLKVFGHNHPEFEQAVLKLLRNYCDAGTTFKVSRNESRKGRYRSLTITFRAGSRSQMDKIYQALSDSDDVVMTL